MNKTRKLPPKLADELGRTIGNTIDGDAVGAAVTLAASGRFGEVAAPLGRVFKPQSINRLTGLADDFAAIYRAGGVPAMKESLALAELDRRCPAPRRDLGEVRQGLPRHAGAARRRRDPRLPTSCSKSAAGCSSPRSGFSASSGSSRGPRQS